MVICGHQDFLVQVLELIFGGPESTRTAHQMKLLTIQHSPEDAGDQLSQQDVNLNQNLRHLRHLRHHHHHHRGNLTNQDIDADEDFYNKSSDKISQKPFWGIFFYSSKRLLFQ